MNHSLLEVNANGLYCAAGDFYIDPWRTVDYAIVTHAHGDHARVGSKQYLAAAPGLDLLKMRLGIDAAIQGIGYGESITRNGVLISLHPAGHVLGSAQVRIEYRGEVAVVSGDYKLQPDPTCEAFEPLKCHLFVTESTFGLPVFRWRQTAEVIEQIHAWWRANQLRGRTSILYAYSLGKAQRILAAIDASIGPILLHGAVLRYCEAYRQAGIDCPDLRHASVEAARQHRGYALVLAPPSSMHSPWERKFGDVSTAMASGWMQIRGMRRRRAIDRGFVLSDHADWDGLREAVKATGAEQVLVTHGYAAVFARWLTETGIQAAPLAPPFLGEAVEAEVTDTRMAENAEEGMAEPVE